MACTSDQCDPDTAEGCSYGPLSTTELYDLCGPPAGCQLVSCVEAADPSLAQGLDCDDGDACTVDACLGDGTCTYSGGACTNAETSSCDGQEPSGAPFACSVGCIEVMGTTLTPDCFDGPALSMTAEWRTRAEGGYIVSTGDLVVDNPSGGPALTVPIADGYVVVDLDPPRLYHVVRSFPSRATEVADARDGVTPPGLQIAVGLARGSDLDQLGVPVAGNDANPYLFFQATGEDGFSPKSPQTGETMGGDAVVNLLPAATTSRSTGGGLGAAATRCPKRRGIV